MSVNKVILVGNIGKDPEVKRGDKPVAHVTVATTEKWTDRNGERQEKTEWHSVVVFGKTVDFVDKYIRKGDSVFVEGKLRTESYEKDGEKKYTVRVYADSIQRVGMKREDRPQPARDESPAPSQQEYFESNPDDLPW